jgi:hypothetical protein
MFSYTLSFTSTGEKERVFIILGLLLLMGTVILLEGVPWYLSGGRDIAKKWGGDFKKKEWFYPA